MITAKIWVLNRIPTPTTKDVRAYSSLSNSTRVKTIAMATRQVPSICERALPPANLAMFLPK